ncbi:MAG: hypothetical protein OHK0057_17910 [Thermoflexibacter sp.]
MAQGKLKIERRASELSIRLNFYCAYHQVLLMRVTAIYIFVITAFYFSSEVNEAYESVRTAFIVASVLSSIDFVRILYGVVNNSYITLTPSELQLRFGPLPMRGGLKIPSREIEQFVVSDRYLSYQTSSGAVSKARILFCL